MNRTFGFLYAIAAKFLNVFGTAEARDVFLRPLNICLVKWSVHNSGSRSLHSGSSEWVVGKHSVPEVGNVLLNQIYPVLYSEAVRGEPL